MANRNDNRFRTKFLRFLLVFILLAFSGLAIASQAIDLKTPTYGIIMTVVTPIQRLVSGSIDAFSAYLAKVKRRSNLEYEYNQLLAQNDTFLYQSLLNTELTDENNRLRALLGEYESRISMNPLLAHITASETGNWFSVFTIDKGTVDGVSVDNAVITSNGLIGHVYEVFTTSAKVITIIDNDSSIAGVIESSRDQGIVRGSLGSDGEPLCRMYYLPVDNVPRPGDSVITSGVGSAFPAGLLIGYVRESTRALESNKHYIVIEPAADFQHIEEVLVLRYEPDVQEMPDYDDDDVIVVPLDTPKPQAVIDEGLIISTPVPLPDAPGRATVEPSPTVLPEGGSVAEPYEPARIYSEDEEDEMLQDFLNEDGN